MVAYRVTSASGSVVATFDADADADAADRGRALVRAHRSGSRAGEALTVHLERRSPDGWEVLGSWEVPPGQARRPDPGDPAR